MRRLVFITAAMLLAGCGGGTPGQGELERGVREIERSNFNAARTQLEKSIASRPGSEQNLEAYNYLGIANWHLGKTQDAMEAFESARRLSPISPEPTYNLGVLCAESGDAARAMQLLKDAALMDEKDPRPLEFMGSLYAKKQQWPEARRSFYAARSRAPASPRILTAIALVELETEKPETAIATLQAALGHDANYAPALFNLGVIYQTRLGDPANARIFLQRFLGVVKAGPQADYARRALTGNAAAIPPGTAAREQVTPVPGTIPPSPLTRTPPASLPAQPPNYSGGQDLLAKARDAVDHGRSTEALNFCLQAGQQAAVRGDKVAQEKALRLGVQLLPDSAHAHTELGNFLLAQGQYEASLRSFKSALTLDENFSAAYLGEGRAASHVRGEEDSALDGFKRAVAADPTSADALWLLAQFYDRTIELPPNAIKSYSDFLKLFPGDSRAALARERVRTLNTVRHTAPPAENISPSTRPGSAAAMAAHATTPPPTTTPERTPPPNLPSKLAPEEVNPDVAASSRPAASGERNPAAARQAFSRGADYQQRGDWNNALFYYEQAVRNDDRLDPAWFNLGAGYSLRGDTGKAKDAYLRALDLRPDYTEARYNLAVLYIEMKDYAAAEKMLADLTQRKPDYANGYLALGQIYARNSATLSKAKAAYQKFLELAPNSRSAAGVRQWLQAQP